MVKSALMENEIEEGDVVMWWSEIMNDVVMGEINYIQEDCGFSQKDYTLSQINIEVRVLGEHNREVLGEVNVVRMHDIFTMDYIKDRYSELVDEVE